MEEYIRTQRDDAARGIAHGAARKSAKDAGPLVPDYTLLHRRLRARGLSQRSVSRMIGVSESHFCRKLSGLYDFTQEDIRLLCGLLEIGQGEIGRYFFAPKVEKSQLPCWRRG